jgi:hypothetical protein
VDESSSLQRLVGDFVSCQRQIGHVVRLLGTCPKVTTPEKLQAAVAAAADSKFTSTSQYARQAIIKELKADGFEELSAA